MGHSLTIALLALTLEGMPVEKGSKADPIVEEALARAEWAARQEYESGYRFKVSSVSEELDGDGEVEEREKRVYQSRPVDGVPYPHLVEINGRELTPEELAEERSRLREFRERLAEGDEPDGENQRVAFDRDLVRRYDYRWHGRDEVNGQDCYVLRFRPKAVELPVSRRIDRALNNSAGTLWIDSETYEIVRLEFELIDEIKIWWGFIGSISRMNGYVEREPVDDHGEAWLPRRFGLYMKGRVLFRSIHRNRSIEWSDFEPVAERAVTSP